MQTMRYIVEKEKIAHNIRALRQRAGGRRIYAVLKADGYGLGCRELAAVCAENGLRCFAVTNLQEAEAVVSAGIEIEELLLMASAAPEQIPRLADLGVTFTVASAEDAQNLESYQVRAHIKVDTGMGRRGFCAEESGKIASLYTQFPHIRFTGIYTHFSNGANSKTAQRQFDAFRNVLKELERQGIRPGVRHCCNSAATFCQRGMMLDGIRVGSALLGRIVGGESRFGLRRTGMCQVPIESVRHLQKGAAVGYGGIYRARRDLKVALCPVGTHHGFGLMSHNGLQSPVYMLIELLRLIRNRLAGRGTPGAMIGGRHCKALGCICSEVAMLDVTGVACRAGDLAEFDINPMLLHDVPVEFI